MESTEWPTEPADRVQLLVERVLEQLELGGDVVIEEDDEAITATVEGDEDYGLLIGRRGQTIDALQLLCFQGAFQGMRERKRVVLDAAGYRGSRYRLRLPETSVNMAKVKTNHTSGSRIFLF